MYKDKACKFIRIFISYEGSLCWYLLKFSIIGLPYLVKAGTLGKGI